jgi:hypothetical protein
MEDEHFGLGVMLCDSFRRSKGLLVRLVFSPGRIVVQIITVAVDDAHYRVQRRRFFSLMLSFTLKFKTGAARRQHDSKRSTRRLQDSQCARSGADRSPALISHGERMHCWFAL